MRWFSEGCLGSKDPGRGFRSVGPVCNPKVCPSVHAVRCGGIGGVRTWAPSWAMWDGLSRLLSCDPGEV